jgi:putative ABC transport system ATP-binding protein
MMGGIDRPTDGNVLIRGNEIFKMKDEALTIFRRRQIGFIFQNFNLVPVLNAYENIILPLELDGVKPDHAYLEMVTKALGLTDRIEHMPAMMSGGQQQRVAIARALATKPAIILADEPTGNLDSKTTQDVMLLLKKVSRQFNQTIVMITHNEEIAQMADRIIRIEDGQVKGRA